MKKLLVILMLCLMLLSCATVGQNFRYSNIEYLILGETTKSQSETLFGSGGTRKAVSNEYGEFETISYVFGSGSLASVTARVLFLEYKGDKLNAYIHVSGFREDSTDFNFYGKDKIEKGVTTKEELIQFLGEPAGKACLPTTLKDFAATNDEYSELWLWSYVCPSEGLDTSTLKSKSVKVFIDDQGIAQKVESEKEL